MYVTTRIFHETPRFFAIGADLPLELPAISFTIL